MRIRSFFQDFFEEDIGNTGRELGATQLTSSEKVDFIRGSFFKMAHVS